ncbi:exported hypothetical protein [Planktothrix serta PCC 8927]|uniref:Uncharacterized protein n=1 Tax=Planktothrix serta PCC 8927 TaxID=671068 RepID=A0A7Z9BYC9_9CYAN|nr:hypothetical protein [Planktothrix serta]VXD25041.1 exported hypothetical protein [Planktothrix serta PCC 8927]
MLTLSKFSVLCLLSGTLFFNATIANAIPQRINTELTQVYRQAPSDLIDEYTDHFFYQTNPELQGRKLTNTDQDYIREWHNLRAAIAPLIKPSQEACPLEKSDVGWDFDLNGMPKSYSSVYDYLADTIFYSRYPEMLGQKLQPGTATAQEWSVIRSRLFVSTCGL